MIKSSIRLADTLHKSIYGISKYNFSATNWAYEGVKKANNEENVPKLTSQARFST